MSARRNHTPPSIPDVAALPDDALITRRQLSIVRNYSIPTLKVWAKTGRGPAVVLVEGRPRYRVAAVRPFLRGEGGVFG